MKNIIFPVVIVGMIFLTGGCNKSDNASLASLTTQPVTSISVTSAISGGNITSDGGAAVTERGVCWGTSSNPTVADSRTSDGSGTGQFVSTMNALNSSTLYYVRAYATNSAGTAYGNELTFTTVTPQLAELTTAAVTQITGTTAISGGDVTNDGGSDITARGVCWSISHGPTAAGAHTSDGSGKGSFVSNLTGLTAGTTYYVRAYATNTTSTYYGNEVSFTTTSGQSGTSVSIQGMAFIPASITIAVNTTVTWTNNDAVTHTVTSDTPLFNSGNMAGNGSGTFSFTFTSAGTFPYHCSIHPDMTATVIVQ
jgi:plastocyanin